MSLSVNLNDTVYVRLNAFGAKLWETHWEALKDTPHFDRAVSRREPDGRLKVQLWTLIEAFGPGIHIGANIPFVDGTVDLT